MSKNFLIRLEETETGLALTDGNLRLIADFSPLLERVSSEKIGREMLIKAAKPQKSKTPLKTEIPTINTFSEDNSIRISCSHTTLPIAIDATAGLGEDSFLLAAAGYRVFMIEKNPIIAALLQDALFRGAKDERIAPIISRMQLIEGDSTEILKHGLGSLPEATNKGTFLSYGPTLDAANAALIYLDPMFPGRTKSGLIKKKFQLLQQLEAPESNPEAIFNAALNANPEKIIVKRPGKEAPITNTIKPTYIIPGKVIRYDCYYFPKNHKTS